MKKFMVLLKIENLDRVQISFYVVSAAGDREGPNRLPLHRPLSLASFFFSLMCNFKCRDIVADEIYFLSVLNIKLGESSNWFCVVFATDERWSFIECDLESDLRIFRCDMYLPSLAVFFYIMTTQGQNTDVLSSDQKKFMLITE